MNIFNSHIKLYGLASIFFISLSIVVAIIPAKNNQTNNSPLPGSAPISEEVIKGKNVYIANGCVACHSQQVRNIDMDKPYGSRPSIAADYANSTRISWWMNPATLMGTERTGPDLTNIGNRLPSIDWHLVHLYNPRAVISESIMPSYEWLFELKDQPSKTDKVVRVPDEFLKGKGVLVAKEEALNLVAYLQSLKQEPLPSGLSTPPFLFGEKQKVVTENATIQNQEEIIELDGAQLYAANCQACHQANGEGLKGAFPALKGSKIVQDENPEILIEIILKGYNGREEFGEMPPIGTMNKLSPAEIAAIINHERTSWGNQAKKVTEAEVEKIIKFLDQEISN